MKLTNKQVNALKVVEWFEESDDLDSRNDLVLGLGGVVEDKDGISPEEAYFLYSERGKLPMRVNNLPRLRRLLWGQRWMAQQVAEWKSDASFESDAPIFFHDFLDDPDYIKDLVQREVKFNYVDWNDFCLRSPLFFEWRVIKGRRIDKRKKRKS